MRLLLSLRLIPLGEECSPWAGWPVQYGEWFTGMLVSVPLVLSPDPPTPDSPQVFLVQYALPLSELRVSGYKQYFVHWLFLRDSLRLQLSLPGRQKSCCFSQLDVIWVPFWLWYYRLVSPVWGLDSTLLKGKHCLLKYPFGISAAIFGIIASPLATPPHSVPVLLWGSGFFLLSVVMRLFSSYCSVGYSGRFLYNLVVILDCLGKSLE